MKERRERGEKEEKGKRKKKIIPCKNYCFVDR